MFKSGNGSPEINEMVLREKCGVLGVEPSVSYDKNGELNNVIPCQKKVDAHQNFTIGKSLQNNLLRISRGDHP